MPCDLRLTQNKLSQMLLLLLSKLIFQEIYTLIQDNTVQLAGLGLEPTYFLILLSKSVKRQGLLKGTFALFQRPATRQRGGGWGRETPCSKADSLFLTIS